MKLKSWRNWGNDCRKGLKWKMLQVESCKYIGINWVGLVYITSTVWTSRNALVTKRLCIPHNHDIPVCISTISSPLKAKQAQKHIFKKKKDHSMSVLQSKGGPIHHSSSDHYYSPPHGPKDDRNWSPHIDSYELMVGTPLNCGHFRSAIFWKL